MPYVRYQTEILDVAISNELWIPKHKEFSFITDPHRAKIIDVPFVAVGMIEGSVFRTRRQEQIPVPGLKVTVTAVRQNVKKMIPLFQDGSLYYIGLAPGSYTISVDSVQLHFLGLTAQPAVREFEIKTTAAGDAVSGLDFILVEVKKQADSGNTGTLGTTAPDNSKQYTPDSLQSAPTVQPIQRVGKRLPNAVQPTLRDSVTMATAVQSVQYDSVKLAAAVHRLNRELAKLIRIVTPEHFFWNNTTVPSKAPPKKRKSR